MSAGLVSGHFLAGAKGPLFVLLRRPVATATGCVLVVPPFAEEMNKCRRMVTGLAQRLAQQGVATLVPDLFGTGDSGGDFSDGDWSTWLDDLFRTADWSAAQGLPVTGLVAIRLGAALAVAGVTAGLIGPVASTVLWQPVFDGRRFLGQFLRLRTAASMMEDRRETLQDLRAQLSMAGVLEVAGYGLSDTLATDLDAVAPPASLPAALGAVSWLEVVREPGAPLPPASDRLVEQTRAQGGAVAAAGCYGEPFWSSTEIVVNSAMVESALSHFINRVPSEAS